VGAKCWDRIAKGYSILNIGRKAKASYCVLENDDYKAVKSATGMAINVLDSSLGVYLWGRLGGPVIMSKQLP
jgi:hypothetical protein